MFKEQTPDLVTIAIDHLNERNILMKKLHQKELNNIIFIQKK